MEHLKNLGKRKDIECQQCHGLGRVTGLLKNWGTLDWETHIYDCPQVGCTNGKIDREAYYKTIGVKTHDLENCSK